MGQTIACANQKGGVGKTTTVVNLATYCAIAGDRVLVVDLDPQGNATSGLGLDRATLEHSIYDAVVDDLPIDRLIVPGPFGLDVVPSPSPWRGPKWSSRPSRRANAVSSGSSDRSPTTMTSSSIARRHWAC